MLSHWLLDWQPKYPPHTVNTLKCNKYKVKQCHMIYNIVVHIPTKGKKTSVAGKRPRLRLHIPIDGFKFYISCMFVCLTLGLSAN